MEARTRFIPSPLPICQIKASAAWFLKGQSLACSSYQMVLWRPSMQHELLDRSAQLTPRGSCCHNARSPARGSRVLLQPSPPSGFRQAVAGSCRLLPGTRGPGAQHCHCAGKSEAVQALNRDPGVTVNLSGADVYIQGCLRSNKNASPVPGTRVLQK